jgi:hypothetical protein
VKELRVDEVRGELEVESSEEMKEVVPTKSSGKKVQSTDFAVIVEKR